MELNSLLGRIGKARTQTQEKFLALIIGRESVHSAVWQANDPHPKIETTGSLEEYNGDADKLITAADASLSTALENVSPEPNKVILGLPENWVEGEKIASSKQKLLRELLEKLSLKPIGFVVVAEAIINFIKIKEGTPLTTILIELTETEATISLVKVGKIVSNHTVGRSDDLGSDVEEGLARFKSPDSLPSRMLLVDGHLDLEAARQTLLSYAWQEKLPFLHVPKIELLDKDIPLHSVVVAAGTQSVSGVAPAVKPKEPKADLEKHGFYPDKDVHKKQQTAPVPSHPPQPQKAVAPPVDKNAPQRIEEPQLDAEPKPQNFLAQLLEAPKKALAKVTSVFQKGSQSLSSGSKKLPPMVIILLVVVLLVGGGAVIAYFRVPKAQVTLYLNPKNIETEIDFTIASGRSTDPDRNRIKGDIVEIDLEDQLQKDTTGSSLIGDEATGEVTIFNKTSNLKKFSAGTVIVGPSSLEFELDEDVSIASQSANTGTFGTTDTKVTSLAVGSESNLSNDTVLTIKGFDSSNYSAKAKGAFTGGSSKEIRSVSEEDRETLLEDLTEKLEAKADEELNKEINPDETLVNSGYEQEVVSQKFTKAVGEETDSIGLTMKLRLTTLKFKTEDLLLLIQDDTSEVPEGFISLESASEIDIEEAIVEDGEAEVTAVLTTKLIPKLDQEEIISNLRGKFPESTESYLKSLPSFARVEIELSPKLPKRLATFPRRIQNITLNIEVEEK